MLEAVSTITPYIALFFGIFFLVVYAIKYYVSIGIVLLTKQNHYNNNKNSLKTILNNANNERSSIHNDKGYQNFGKGYTSLISIHIPLYNEKNVAKRILEACLSLDYPNIMK